MLSNLYQRPAAFYWKHAGHLTARCTCSVSRACMTHQGHEIIPSPSRLAHPPSAMCSLPPSTSSMSDSHTFLRFSRVVSALCVFRAFFPACSPQVSVANLGEINSTQAETIVLANFFGMASPATTTTNTTKFYRPFAWLSSAFV